MNRQFLWFLLLFLLIAVLFQETALVTLVYLLFGIFILGSLWSRSVLNNIRCKRSFDPHVFLGEHLTVSFRVWNAGWLPAGWVRLQESLPVELTVPRAFQWVFSLGPHEEWRGEYRLQANKRGYYRVGPVNLESGDLFHLSSPGTVWSETDYLTVFPQIVPMPEFSLPSSSPMGTMRSTRPVHEDPTRIFGKREYQTGDSQRRIDWKATAAAGRLQVKIFEPSQSLETVLFLGLHPEEYEAKDRDDATELAVVAAASVAHWVIQKRQTAGLTTNGTDPTAPHAILHLVPPRKGRGHLLRILDLLARIQTGHGDTLETLLIEESKKLAWGTTIVAIAGRVQEPLLDALLQVRRDGHRPVLFVTSSRKRNQEFLRRAERFGVSLHEIQREQDLASLR